MHLHVLLFLILLQKAMNFPLLNDTQNSGEDFEEDFDYEFYDQRQNGSENYRINVNGVVFFMAPVHSLFGSSALDEDDEDEGGEVEATFKPNVTVNGVTTPLTFLSNNATGGNEGDVKRQYQIVGEKNFNRKISKQKPQHMYTKRIQV